MRLIAMGTGMLGLLGCPLFAAFSTESQAVTVSKCPTDKIVFEQAQGCMNDGSVEFCIPADDPAALQAVRAIDPGISCMQGSRGRAGCDQNSEILCLTETQPYCKTDHDGKIDDRGWARLCAFARLPVIRRIVPTWYE